MKLVGEAWKKLVAAFLLLGTVAVPGAVQADVNKESIGILAGYPGSTSVKLGEELARALDGWSGVRVRTLVGAGAQQNVDDLLYLRGVDLAFLNSDVMTNIRITQPDHPALRHISYIAKVTEAELHLIVRDESEAHSIYDLAGKRVGIGKAGSGTALTSRLMLRLLDVRATGIFMDPAQSLEALRAGELDAVFILGAKPLPILENLRAEDGLRLAGIDFPFNEGLANIYTEAEFVPEDYPNLVKEKHLPAIGVPVVLAAYGKFSKGSTRYNNIQTFTEAFLETIPRLQQPPRHPKWQQIDLGAEVSGWSRLGVVERALESK